MISPLPPIVSVAPDAPQAEKRAAFERVAESFEAVFVSQLIRGLRETFCKDYWGGAGFGKEIYADWFDQAMAETITRAGGLGVKDQLQRWAFPAEKATSPAGAGSVEAAGGLRFSRRF
jgi:Rod binding domain-containing protein